MIRTKEKTKKRNYCLPLKTKQWLKEMADKKNRSSSNMLSVLIDEAWLKEIGNQETEKEELMTTEKKKPTIKKLSKEGKLLQKHLMKQLQRRPDIIETIRTGKPVIIEEALEKKQIEYLVEILEELKLLRSSTCLALATGIAKAYDTGVDIGRLGRKKAREKNGN